MIQYNDFQIGKPNDLNDMYGNFTLDDFIFWNTEMNSTSVLQLYQSYSKYRILLFKDILETLDSVLWTCVLDWT